MYALQVSGVIVIESKDEYYDYNMVGLAVIQCLLTACILLDVFLNLAAKGLRSFLCVH